MESGARPRILCVDDEPQILEGIALHLRRRYDLLTATSGAAGLEILERGGGFAVVVSDMRMPSMGGASFLHQARERAPDAVRMLLTGQTDMESAISAVNEGQIFRFLTKPCPPPLFAQAIQAAVAQHQLVTAEKVLLEQTLHGSIRALTDALALANPVAFSRANQLKKRVSGLASQLRIGSTWQVEVAAMLSHLGTLAVPAETLEKAQTGQALSESEQAMVARIPAVTEQLIAHIPRLETVREILTDSTRPPSNRVASESARVHVQLSAQILRVAAAFDALEGHGQPAARALEILRGRSGQYDPSVLSALGDLLGAAPSRHELREIGLAQVRVGMVFAEDVRLSGGALLVAHGFEVTPSFLERARNFGPGSLREPLRVILPVVTP